MAGAPLVYVDVSEVRPGALEEVRVRARELAAFVDAQEPRVLLYHVYVDDAERLMTVVQLHPDAASLELHMDVAGPLFVPFAPLLRLLSIDVYGSPGDALLERLHRKAELLGSAPVRVHALHAGTRRTLAAAALR